VKVFLIRSGVAKMSRGGGRMSEGSQIDRTIMTLSEFIRVAVETGHRDGFVTFNQLHDWLPPAPTEPEDMVAVMETLRDEGIDVRDQ
jgi:hypothetical protein